MPIALILLSFFALTACDVDGPPAQIMKNTYTAPELRQSICEKQAKSCVTIKGVTWFIDRGYVFTLDERSNKHWRHVDKAVEIVAYKAKPFILDQAGEVKTFDTVARGEEIWFTVSRDVRDLTPYCDDLLTLTKETGDIRRFAGGSGPVKWTLSPHHRSVMVPCGEGCVSKGTAIEYLPQLNGNDLSFSPTPFHAVREMKSVGGTLELTGFDGSKRIYK